MEEYELRNAKRWEEEERPAPVRKLKKKPPKRKKKSAAGSVVGSDAGSVRGSRPASPARSVSSNTNKFRPASRAQSPARSVSSNTNKFRPASRAQSVRSSGPFPSSSSEPDLLSPPPSEYEPESPWGDEKPRYQGQYDSDFQSGEFYGDPDEAYGAYAAVNFYHNDDPAQEMEAYESPDGLRRENEGVRLERSGYEPNAFFTVLAGRSPTFDERFFGPNSVNLRHIAAKTNTYIDVPDDPDEPDIPVWGKPDHVTIAIRDLMLLVEHIQHEMERSKKKKGGSWKKIRAAPSDRMQIYLEQKRREAIRIKNLRHPPPKGHFEFNAVGVFFWPRETEPKDYLGLSFERLDDIRGDCNVYIVDSRQSEGYMFQVLGEDQESVQKAADRLYGTFCEVAAMNRKITDKFLVHPPSAGVQNISVSIIKEQELKDRQINLRPGTVGYRALLIGDSSREFLEDWKVRRQKLEWANHSYIRTVVEQGLKDVLYHRGHASLKIHFGTLVFFGLKLLPPGKNYSLEDFCSMVRDPIGMTAGEVIRHIGEDNVAKALINECHARKDLFHHVDSGSLELPENLYSNVPEYTEHDLSIPEPTISATFELKITDAERKSHDIRLEIQFDRIPGQHPGDIVNEGGDLYKVGMRRWLYIRSCASNSRGPARPRHKGPFDIRVLDLESDLAWQFELNTYRLCPETDGYGVFNEFVRRIRVEDIPDESDLVGPPTSGRADCRKRVQRISYVNLPGIVVEKVVQKTKHQFWITKTEYMFEITRYECFFTEEVNRLYPCNVRISWKGLDTDHDIRWGASLTNVNWGSTLAKQTSIGIGCPGGWEPEINFFFKSSGIGGFDHPVWTREGKVLENPDPWGGDGWKELMTRVDEITRFIAGVRMANVIFTEPGYAGPEEFDE